jgi:hypothetical protein
VTARSLDSRKFAADAKLEAVPEPAFAHLRSRFRRDPGFSRWIGHMAQCGAPVEATPAPKQTGRIFPCPASERSQHGRQSQSRSGVVRFASGVGSTSPRETPPDKSQELSGNVRASGFMGSTRR